MSNLSDRLREEIVAAITKLAAALTVAAAEKNALKLEGLNLNEVVELAQAGKSATSALADNATLLGGMTPEDIISLVTKDDVGLSNILNFPIASLEEAELGTAADRYMTVLRTKQLVDKVFADFVGSAPTGLDTVYKLAAALGNDPNFVTTITNMIGSKLDATATAVNSDKLEGFTLAQVITQALSGKAASAVMADRLTLARSFSMTGDGTWTVTFNGTQDVSGAFVLNPIAISKVTGLQSALDGKVANDDSRLSDAREWIGSTITQAEAEAGTATTRRAWTAQRVRQAIAAWWSGSSDKNKLDGIATGATANATDAQLRDRSTHTGAQAISTVTGLQTALDAKEPSISTGTVSQFFAGTKAWRDFATDVRAALMTGVVFTTTTTIAAGDQLIIAMGKLQGQINTLSSGKEGSIAAGTTAQFWRGDKTWQDLATAVRAAVLTGLSTATATAVVATDGILTAVGKLQGQINTLSSSKLNVTGGSLSGDISFTNNLGLQTASGARYFRSNGTDTILSAQNGIIYLRPQGDANATGQVTIAADGSVSAPTFNATSSTNGGFQGIDSDTAAAPSFTWSGDLDTGIYRAGADIIAFSCGGVERGRINSTGWSGNGSQLTALNANNLGSGTIPDARLSGTYSGFTHKIDGSNSLFTTPNVGSPNSAGRTVFGLAEYRSAAASQVGAIVFIAPVAHATAMSQFDIKGMLHNQNIVDIVLQGYRNTGAWSATRKINQGSVDIQVRFGVTPDGRNCIILGDVGTSWSYPHIGLSRAMISHTGGVDGSVVGWEVATVTDLTGYTNVTADIATNVMDTTVSVALSLNTARTINGTAFNGTGNITTALWGTARTLSFTGDVTGSASVNGGANVSFAMTLANSGVAAGTYGKVTVDAKGRVTAGAALAAADIPNLDTSKMTSGTLPIARGGTGGTTQATAKAALGIGSMADRNVFISTANPSGGADGDIWIKYV